VWLAITLADMSFSDSPVFAHGSMTRYGVLESESDFVNSCGGKQVRLYTTGRIN
jgi:hypothetical protein